VQWANSRPSSWQPIPDVALPDIVPWSFAEKPQHLEIGQELAEEAHQYFGCEAVGEHHQYSSIEMETPPIVIDPFRARNGVQQSTGFTFPIDYIMRISLNGNPSSW
jgi:hypothetical protein